MAYLKVAHSLALVSDQKKTLEEAKSVAIPEDNVFSDPESG